MTNLYKVIINEFPSNNSETSQISVGKVIPRQLIIKHKPIPAGTDYKIYIKRDIASAYEVTPIITSNVEGSVKKVYDFPDNLTYTFLQFKLVTANAVTLEEPELVFIYNLCDFEGQAKEAGVPIVQVDLTGIITPVNVTGGFVMCGVYAGATDYAVGDVVNYNGSSYVMYVDAVAGTLPTDNTKWQLLAQKGDTGNGITDGAVGFTYTGGTSPKTLTVPNDASITGINTGDQDRIVSLHFLTDSDLLVVGDGIITFTIPSELNGMNLVNAQASVVTASTSGLPTIQVNNLDYAGGASDVLTTPITIDANEYNSNTAATPRVINAAKDDVATGNRLRVDIDVAGTGTKGGTIFLTFRTP